MIDLTETKLSLESSKTNPKYLVVDHDLVNTNEKREFAKMTMLPMEAGIFVATYEAALKAVKSHPNIALCFVDIRIPKQEDNRAFNALRKIKLKALSSQIKDIKNEWGIKLLPQIKNIKTFIYSSRVDISFLEKEADYHANVIGFGVKPFTIQDIQIIEPYLESYFPPQKLSTLTPFFDYSSLDEETLSFVQLRTEKIKQLVKRTSQDMVDIGRYLIEVKDRLGYGNFYPWLDVEFGWGSRTAVRFMRVAERFGQIDNLSDLNILSTALYVLSAPSTPVEATAEAIERAKQGEKISDKTAIAIKAKYKALKEQTESKVQPNNISTTESNQTENRKRILPVDSLSQNPSLLSEKKDKVKQEILTVIPSENAVKNSWWQLGEHNRLFCGEPKSNEFLKRLPQNIGLSMTFLPENNFSLVPSIEAIFSCAFRIEYEDIDLDSAIKLLIEKTTQPDEVIVFNYLYYIELLDVAENLKCHFVVAEPDLEKCEQILTMWREKGSVIRWLTDKAVE